jgi:hypothetical protein
MYEAQKVMQPIRAQLDGVVADVDQDNCNLTVILSVQGEYDHILRLSSELVLRWALLLDGREHADGSMKGDEKNAISFRMPVLRHNEDCRIRVTAALKDSKSWAEAGHIVCFEDIELGPEIIPCAYHAEISPQNSSEEPSPVEVAHTPNLLSVSTQTSKFEFCRQQNRLIRMQAVLDGECHNVICDHQDSGAGGEGISAPSFDALCLQLHRAPTDNDRGGYVRMWEAAGLTSPLEIADAGSLTWEERERDGVVLIRVRHVLRPSTTINLRNLQLMHEIESYMKAVTEEKSPEPLYLRNLSDADASFVQWLASVWRLGHSAADQVCRSYLQIFIQCAIVHSANALNALLHPAYCLHCCRRLSCGYLLGASAPPTHWQRAFRLHQKATMVTHPNPTHQAPSIRLRRMSYA